MTHLIACKQQSAHLSAIKYSTCERQQKIQLIAAQACIVAAFNVSLFLEAPEAIQIHTSLLTGQKWLSKLLDGHPTWFWEQLGMAKHAFYWLSFELQAYSGLVASKFISADEKLVMFLHFVQTGCSSCMLQERFQHSAETIHKYFKSIFISWLVLYWRGRQIYLFDSWHASWLILQKTHPPTCQWHSTRD